MVTASNTERKLIVISDSHGNTRNLTKLFEMHRDADAFIHLGDGAYEFSRLCRQFGVIGYSVLGNCDSRFICSDAQDPYTVAHFANYRFFMTHGHLYGVKSGRETLIAHAKKALPDVDFVLYGHTHLPENRYIPAENEGEKPLYLINPGSISLPRQSGTPTYALILIKDKNIITNIAELNI